MTKFAWVKSGISGRLGPQIISLNLYPKNAHEKANWLIAQSWDITDEEAGWPLEALMIKYPFTNVEAPPAIPKPTGDML